jgi:hypothetical protein
VNVLQARAARIADLHASGRGAEHLPRQYDFGVMKSAVMTGQSA